MNENVVPLIGASRHRLPYSDMTAKQMFELAEIWWNGKGRDLMRHNHNRPRDGVKDDVEMVQASGILQAKLFNDLSQDEQIRITGEFYVVYCRDQGMPKVRANDVQFILRNT